MIVVQFYIMKFLQKGRNKNDYTGNIHKIIIVYTYNY